MAIQVDEETELVQEKVRHLSRDQMETLFVAHKVINKEPIADTEDMRDVLVQLVVDRVIPLEDVERYVQSM